MSHVDFIRFVPCDLRHVNSAASVANELGWSSYADSETTRAAFSAVGASTWVAIRDERVIGLAHILANAIVRAYLSFVGVLLEYRRSRISKWFIVEAFAQSGAKWLDLWAEPESEDCNRSFLHQEYVGCCVYPKLNSR